MLAKLPEILGESLRHQRAGIDGTALHRLDRCDLPVIQVHSAAFAPDGLIPMQYTADGAGYSPPVQWQGVPADAATVVLIVEDADSPTPHPLVHAIVVDIDAKETQLAEGAINSHDHAGFALQVGRNSFLRQSWLPPDPPPGHGDHRYVFQIFALASGQPFSNVPGRQEVLDALRTRALAAGYVVGRYSRGERANADAEDSAADGADGTALVGAV